MADVGGVTSTGMTGLNGRTGWGLVEDPGHEEIKTYGEVGGISAFGEIDDKKAVTEAGQPATGQLVEAAVQTGGLDPLPEIIGGTQTAGGLPAILERLEGGERGLGVVGSMEEFIKSFKGDPALLKLMMALLDILMGKGDPMQIHGLLNEIKGYLNTKASVQFPQHEPWNAIVTRPDGTTQTVAVPPGTTSWPDGQPLPTPQGPVQVTQQSNYDPLKITLDGTDATLNTTDHSKIQMEDGKVHVMSGGLNDNEAWLVKDQDADGLRHNGVIDGRDVIGDHGGKYKDAYDQLAHEYAGELKTDASGRKYIDLADPNSKAAKELKLMDKAGNIIDASSKLTALYVTHAEVNKVSSDGLTSIKQEGLVEYKDGHTAKAADQWFSDAATPVLDGGG